MTVLISFHNHYFTFFHQIDDIDIPDKPTQPQGIQHTAGATVIRRDNAPTRARKTVVRAYA